MAFLWLGMNLPGHVVSANDQLTSVSASYAKFKIKPGDTLSNIFRRLKIKNIWGPNGYIERTVRLNKAFKTPIRDKNQLDPGTVIFLPIAKTHPKLNTDINGLARLRAINTYPALPHRRKYVLKKNQNTVKVVTTIIADPVEEKKRTPASQTPPLPVPAVEYDAETVLGYKPATEEKTQIRYKTRNIASTPTIRKDAAGNFDLTFDCGHYDKDIAYKKAQEFITKNKGVFKNMSLTFKCDSPRGAQAPVVIQSVPGAPVPVPVQTPQGIVYKVPEKKKPVKLKPWMMSFEKKKANGRSPSAVQKESYFFPSIGFSSAGYKEGDLVDTEFTNLFVDLNYRQIISEPEWHIDAEVKYGVIASATDVNSAEVNLLDVDVRAGYAFPLLQEPWRFTLFAGAYYTQMFVTNDLFGYKGTYYPQIYPEIRYAFSTGDVLTAYLKFVPTGRDFLSFESNERAFTFGAKYYSEIFGQDVFLNFNYSDLGFTSQDGNSAVELIQYNLGIGTAF